MRKIAAFYAAVIVILFLIVIVLSGCNDNPANANLPSGGGSTGAIPPDSSITQPDTGVIPPDTAIIPPDTAIIPPDTAIIPHDTVTTPPDTATIPPDTGVIPPDTAIIPPDTAIIPPDTIVAPPNPTLTPRDSILDHIDKNWALFGYASKPTKYMALSFDDGPCPQTGDLLAALAAKKVKATFFLIGQNIRGNQSQAKAIYDAGHELANHSDGYSSLGGNTAVNSISTSLAAASAAITGITGKPVTLFRAPNVDYGSNLATVCAQMGLAIIGVSVWSNDYNGDLSSQTIASNVVSNAVDGGIINCHEPNTAPKTVAAIPVMIEGLRQKGFWICTVSELAVIKGKELQSGVRYDSL